MMDFKLKQRILICSGTILTGHVRANGPFPWIRLRGLLPDCLYHLEGTKNAYSGAALMQAGYSFPQLTGDYPAVQLHFERHDLSTDFS